MKYTTEVEIDLPVDRVVGLFDNPDNLPLWMDGFDRIEPVRGAAGTPGSVSRLIFKQGKREMIMTETIEKHDLPSELTCVYEARGVTNRNTTRFEDLGGRTLYRTENEFKFSNLPMKVFSWIMPGAFKKQSLKYMTAFKEFAEAQGA